MKKLSILYYILIILFISGLSSSCSENKDILMFDKDTQYLYFGLPYKQNQSGSPMPERVDSVMYTFAYDLPTVTQHTFKIAVNLSGVSKDKDRTYRIKLDTERTTATTDEYEAIPEEHTIQAGQISDTIFITVNKRGSLTSMYKNIVINLLPTSDFQLGSKEYYSAKISFTDILPEPKWWSRWQTYFGTYSKEKYQIWINTYKKGLDPTPNLYDATPYYYYWETMPPSPNQSWYPVLFMYIKKMKDYLIQNPTYVDNDPTKERILIPYNF